MYKLVSLFVLVAMIACAFASLKPEAQDQEAAEFYYRTYGYYPSWYTGYAYSAYPYSYGYNYGAYPYGKFYGYY